MSTLTVSLELPRDLLGALDVPEGRLETRVRELIALELFREGRISSGKAAELLGVSKGEFIHLLAQHGVPYFTESPEELAAEVATLERGSGGARERGCRRAEGQRSEGAERQGSGGAEELRGI